MEEILCLDVVDVGRLEVDAVLLHKELLFKLRGNGDYFAVAFAELDRRLDVEHLAVVALERRSGELDVAGQKPEAAEAVGGVSEDAPAIAGQV